MLQFLYSALLSTVVNGQVDSQIKIIGGTPVASPSTYPWLAGLDFSTTDKVFIGCGGSLLDETTVLTAAHCSFGVAAKSVAVHAHMLQVSKSAVSEQSVQFKVNEIIIHPKYRDTDPDVAYDIAIWKVTPIKGSDTSVLTTFAVPNDGKKDYTGQMLTVAGWGDIRNGSNTGSDIMRETTVELNTRATCQKVWPKLSPTSLCAGDLLGGKDSCQGDSGGPLFTKTTPPVLVGVVSYGTDCGKTAGVYTNVALLLPWINKVWKGIDTPVVTATATQGVPVPSTTGKSSALIQTANICLSLGLLLTSFFWQ